MKEFNRTPPLDFYPRSPCGERRKLPESNTSVSNFYPRSPCGERRYRFLGAVPSYNISIHALLAESDKPTAGILDFNPLISIHALLAESDISVLWMALSRRLFLSTLSLRRATQ